jgi:hypothetical protein
MSQPNLESDLHAAFAAVRHAQDVRRFHRRRSKKGSKQREDDLATARDRVSKAMIPLRSYLGGAPHRPHTTENDELLARVREASKALQGERRQVWKMQQGGSKSTE